MEFQKKGMVLGIIRDNSQGLVDQPAQTIRLKGYSITAPSPGAIGPLGALTILMHAPQPGLTLLIVSGPLPVFLIAN